MKWLGEEYEMASWEISRIDATLSLPVRTFVMFIWGFREFDLPYECAIGTLAGNGQRPGIIYHTDASEINRYTSLQSRTYDYHNTNGWMEVGP